MTRFAKQSKGQGPSVGWAQQQSFFTLYGAIPSIIDVAWNITEVPVRWDGRALPGGAFGTLIPGGVSDLDGFSDA